MRFIMELGKRVAVLDDDISGTVIEVKGNTVKILTADDFELEYSTSELIVIDGSISRKEMAKMDISSILSEKRSHKPGKTQKIKPKERIQPAMEVDLHIHRLVPKSKFLSPHEILDIQMDTAKRQLEFAISKRIQRVVFIHGVGEGVLRSELEFLFRRYGNLKFYDADYQKYGRGATEVYIFQNAKK